MNVEDLFEISVKKPVCIEGFSEDCLRELVNSLQITVSDDTFSGFVLSSNGTEVKFNFDSNGNFSGVTATINSQRIPIIPGLGSKVLGLYEGPPNATNPGVGWKIESDLTKKFFNQPDNENNWEIFVASREAVINK